MWLLSLGWLSVVDIITKTHQNKSSSHLCDVKAFFKTLPAKLQFDGISLVGLTKYCWQSITFWANPSYKAEGSWFDYAMIAWENQEYASTKKNIKESGIDGCLGFDNVTFDTINTK